MVADYTAKGDWFTAGKPRLWSPTQILNTDTSHADLAPDGKRFAVFPRPWSEEKQGNVQVTFLLNFFDEVACKIPVAK
jgi:hypothetical protein